MNNSVAVDQPHDTRTWMTGDTHTESGWFALLDRLRLQLANEHWFRSGLGIGVSFFGYPAGVDSECIQCLLPS